MRLATGDRDVARWLGAGAVALGVLGSVGVSEAAVPETITHQGRLYDADGVPVTSTVDVAFAIYDSPGAIVPIWTEVHGVTFEEGYFSVALGSVVPFAGSTFDGSARYLGVTVGADPEMTPRAAV